MSPREDSTRKSIHQRAEKQANKGYGHGIRSRGKAKAKQNNKARGGKMAR